MARQTIGFSAIANHTCAVPDLEITVKENFVPLRSSRTPVTAFASESCRHSLVETETGEASTRPRSHESTHIIFRGLELAMRRSDAKQDVSLEAHRSPSWPVTHPSQLV